MMCMIGSMGKPWTPRQIKADERRGNIKQEIELLEVQLKIWNRRYEYRNVKNVNLLADLSHTNKLISYRKHLADLAVLMRGELLAQDFDVA